MRVTLDKRGLLRSPLRVKDFAFFFKNNLVLSQCWLKLCFEDAAH